MRRSSLRQFQKTTEMNVAQKLKRELKNEPALDQALVDQRLQDTLNRESQQELFTDSLVSSVFGNKKKKKETVELSTRAETVPKVNSDEAPEESSTAPQTASSAINKPEQTEVADSNQFAQKAAKEFLVRPTAKSFFDLEQPVLASPPPVVPSGQGKGFFSESTVAPEPNPNISTATTRELPVPGTPREFVGDEPNPNNPTDKTRAFPVPGAPRESAGRELNPKGSSDKTRAFPLPGAPSESAAPDPNQKGSTEKTRSFPVLNVPAEGEPHRGPETDTTGALPVPAPPTADASLASPPGQEPVSSALYEAESAVPPTESESVPSVESIPADDEYASEIIAQVMAAALAPQREEFLPPDTPESPPGLAPHKSLIPDDAPQHYVSAEELEAMRQRAEFLYDFGIRAEDFKNSTGLDMLLDPQDKVQIYLNAAGDSQLLYQVEYSDEGFAEAKLFAKSLCDDFCMRISQEFGLEFVEPGLVAVRQLEPDENNQLVPGEKLIARAPRIDELKALQCAIEYSWPSTYQKEDQLPLKIVFLDQPLVKDEFDGAVLRFLEDGRPVLFVTPELCQSGVPTELDPIATGSTESWQSIIMRELAWKSVIDCNKLPLDDATIDALGWVVLKQISEEERLHGLKDAEGNIYLPYEDASSTDESWVLCNQLGETLDGSGKRSMVIMDMKFISHEEMQRRAQVQPCSAHFFSPEEELVDALKCFRQGPEWRMHLGRINPVLYKLAKSIDQSNINRCYPSEGGKDTHIRSSSGQVVENNASNQKDLLQFEQKLNRKPG